MDDLVVLVNDRDRRTFAWLRNRVGDDAIRAAVDQLAGARKPYISNLCKALGVTAPADLSLSSRDDAKGHLAVALDLLKSSKRPHRR